MFKKVFSLSFLAALLIFGGYYVYKSQPFQPEDVPLEIDPGSLQASLLGVESEATPNGGFGGLIPESQASGLPPKKATTPQPLVVTPLPEELNLKAAFYAQAPHGNWDYPWQEACEEASVLLVANAYDKEEWTKDEFNEEILKLVDWEKITFGDYKHTDVEQTKQMIEDNFGFTVVIHENPTFDDVKKILNKGHFIIGTFAGKELKNPNFSNGGPNYHAMVIKGYKKGEKVITLDVGTKRGKDYVYSWKTLQSSLHDYAEPIQKGKKRFLEVIPASESKKTNGF